MRESMWRFVLGLAIGLAIGAMLPVLEAGISGGGGGGGGAFTELATDTLDADFNTSSVTFVALTGLSATATATASERWLVESRVVFRGGANNIAWSRTLVDEVELGTIVKQEGAAIVGFTATSTSVSQALTAGARTVDMDVRVNAGTGNWFFDGFGTDTTTELRIYALR